MVKKLKILIVDDCKVMQAVICRTLLLAKIEPEVMDTADNGKAGLHILNDKKYDLLILDINMPVMDGMEMIQQIQKNPEISGIPVLFVTTESNEGRKKILSRLGAGLVCKPFTPEVFKREILKVTGDLAEKT